MRAFTLLPLLTTLALASPAPAKPTSTEAAEPSGPWTLDFFNGSDDCKGRVDGASKNEAVKCQKVNHDDIKSYSVASNGWIIQLFDTEDCKINPPLPLTFPANPPDADKPKCQKKESVFTKEHPIKAYSVGKN